MQTKYSVLSINQKKALRTPKASAPHTTWEETSQEEASPGSANVGVSQLAEWGLAQGTTGLVCREAVVKLA